MADGRDTFALVRTGRDRGSLFTFNSNLTKRASDAVRERT